MLLQKADRATYYTLDDASVHTMLAEPRSNLSISLAKNFYIGYEYIGALRRLIHLAALCATRILFNASRLTQFSNLKLAASSSNSSSVLPAK